MCIKNITLLFGTLSAIACSSLDTPQMNAVCDNSQAGVYMLKWELFPMKTGNIKVLESKDPDSFEQAVQVAEKNIHEGFITIPRKDEQRRFFKLIFNKKGSSIIGERHIVAEKITNLRDLGGYYGKNEMKQIRWGKLYRSGIICRLSRKDRIMLDSLHIRTILDLRGGNNPEKVHSSHPMPRMETLPLSKMPIETIHDKILAGQMMKGDVLVAMQDMYAKIIEEDTVALANIFELLIKEENYPLLFYCGLGKDRSGILSILILGALGIDREQIYGDYMLSNQYIDFSQSETRASTLPVEQQEALTTMLRANERVFDFIYDKLKRDYGSIPNYLEKKLHFTAKKRDKLAEILLY